MNVQEVNKSVQNLYSISVRKLACVTVALPFFALFVCFITAYIFQFDDVHETHCRVCTLVCVFLIFNSNDLIDPCFCDQVFNVIPSISAVTGITPQTYLWRISVALHIGPRIIVAHLYRNYFSYLLSLDTAPQNRFKQFFVSSCFWFNIVELSSLCGTTYISNRENYREHFSNINNSKSTAIILNFFFFTFSAIHEKLFIVFMVCSLMFMFTMTLSFKMMHPAMTKVQNVSYKLKLSLLITSLVSTVTLILFFMKHRFYCHDLGLYSRCIGFLNLIRFE